MKKIVLSFLLCLGLAGIPTQRAHATTTLLGGPLVYAVGGGLIIAGGFMGIMGYQRWVENNVRRPVARGTLSIIGTYVLLVPMFFGALMLDSEQEAELEFRVITDGQRGLRDIAARDIAIYNSQVNELNAVYQTVTAEVARDASVLPQDRWEAYSDLLAPETLRVAATLVERGLRPARR